MATMLRRLLSLCTPLALTACSFSACGAPASSAPTTTTAVSPAPAASSALEIAPGTYTLHEWGLLRAGPNDVLEVGAMAPAVEIDPMPVEKPVLYFHLGGDAPLDLGRASVEAVEGSIREHWPLAAPPVGPAVEDRVNWAPLTLRPERCAFLAPADRNSACSALPMDEVCESLSLARTVTDDASCAETATGRSPILFYRSTSRGLTAPIAASYIDFGDIGVRNDSDHAIPGLMIRFIESSSGLSVVVFTPPAPHESVVVGHEDQGTEAARQAILTTMTGIGLTVSEAEAFLSSWDGELFTPPPVEEERAIEEAWERNSLLYFLPPAMTDRVSRLDFDPPPAATHRALAIWTGMD